MSDLGKCALNFYFIDLKRKNNSLFVFFVFSFVFLYFFSWTQKMKIENDVCFFSSFFGPLFIYFLIILFCFIYRKIKDMPLYNFNFYYLLFECVWDK